MKKGIIAIFSLALMGLIVVYGQVEAVRVGYQIRRLSIRKLELTHRMKRAECEIASRIVPRRLEESMSNARVKLAKAELKRIVRQSRKEAWTRPAAPTQPFFAKWFMSEAKAETTR